MPDRRRFFPHSPPFSYFCASIMKNKHFQGVFPLKTEETGALGHRLVSVVRIFNIDIAFFAVL